MVEMVVIALVLGIVAIPLLDGFGTFSGSMHRSTRETGATYLGQAVMEQILRLVTVRPDGSLEVAGLEEAGAAVATGSDGAPSRYFARFENLAGTSFHGITPESDPELFRQLSRYTLDVEVRPPSAAVDSDADGSPERDLVEIGVTVSWQVPGSGRRSTSLWSMVSGRRPGSFE